MKVRLLVVMGIIAMLCVVAGCGGGSGSGGGSATGASGSAK